MRATENMEAMRLLDELIGIGHKIVDPTFSSTGYLTRSGYNKRAIEIGVRLNEIGGMRLMSNTLDLVREALGSGEARELEICWDGIGEWRA